MNGGAKLAKLGANLIIEKRWAEREGQGKRRDEIKRRDRQTNCGLPERKRERERGRSAIEVEKSKYLYDGSLFRPLINGTEEGRCN